MVSLATVEPQRCRFGDRDGERGERSRIGADGYEARVDSERRRPVHEWSAGRLEGRLGEGVVPSVELEDDLVADRSIDKVRDVSEFLSACEQPPSAQCTRIEIPIDN